jgi:hypothetical protein
LEVIESPDNYLDDFVVVHQRATNALPKEKTV